MRFDPPLVRGTLLRRYKRFLADVRLEDGTEVTAHCANPGSMLGVSRPGSAVYLSRSDNPARKLSHSLEAIRVGRQWVGIHPGRANGVVETALRKNRVPELAGYAEVRPETIIAPGSRADFLLTHPERTDCWVEVKYATLGWHHTALFPDSVSERAQKHLRELAGRVGAGDRAVLLFVSPRSDVTQVGPADGIDPAYGEGLRRARDAGVEFLAYRLRVGRRGIRFEERLGIAPGPHPVSRNDLEGSITP